MGIRNPFMRPGSTIRFTKWIIRVRFHLAPVSRAGVERDFWEEYDLGVIAPQLPIHSEESSQADLYDVWLVKKGTEQNMANEVMSELLPHLNVEQMGEIYSVGGPRSLRESVSKAEAEEIQKRLEAIGAVVSVKPAALSANGVHSADFALGKSVISKS
jgi:hypothetical protein